MIDHLILSIVRDVRDVTHDSKTGFGFVKLHREVGRLFAYVIPVPL